MIEPIILTRPKTGLTVLKVILPFAFTGLGIWQISRLSEKQESIKKYRLEMDKEPSQLKNLQDLTSQNWQKYIVNGRFLEGLVLVGPRTKRKGKPGHMALQPFKIFSSDEVVIVNRGWIPNELLFDAENILSEKEENEILVCRNLGDLVNNSEIHYIFKILN